MRKISAIEGTISNLDRRVDEIEKSIVDIKKDVKTLLVDKASRERVDKLYDTLSNLSDHINKKLKEYEEKMRHWEKIARIAEREVVELKKNVDKFALSRELTELKSYINDLVAEYEKRFEKIKERLKNIPKIKDIEDVRRDVRGELKDVISILSSNVKQLKESIEVLEKDLAQKIDENRKNVENLEKRVEEAFKKLLVELGG